VSTTRQTTTAAISIGLPVVVVDLELAGLEVADAQRDALLGVERVGPAQGAAAAEPLRLAGRAFDRRAEIEVRDLAPAAAQGAIEEAFRELERARAELRGIEQTARPDAPLQLDARQAELVRRALGICYWSEGAVGPLGAEVYRIWGLRFPATSFPPPDEIERAVDSARCERAALDVASGLLRVAQAGRLDFFPFEIGWAVDRAAASLRTAGASDFWIEVGGIARAAGPGSTGRGWSYELPPLAGQLEPQAPFFLLDRAVAVLRPGDRALRIAGETFAPYLNLRRGRPGRSGDQRRRRGERARRRRPGGRLRHVRSGSARRHHAARSAARAPVDPLVPRHRRGAAGADRRQLGRRRPAVDGLQSRKRPTSFMRARRSKVR
jgi:thiamine biosynthesis lipoprotein ApbE